MGKLIRLDFLYKIVVALVVCLLSISEVHSQVSITNSRSFELSFTDGDTRTVHGGVEVSVRDPLISAFRQDGRTAIQRYTSAKEEQRGKYYVEAYGDVSVGSYYYQRRNEDLVSISFANRTTDSFDKLSVAFDFIYLAENLQTANHFYLSYRLNDGEWRRPDGGSFSTEFLQSGERGWGSFSMQITLDQVYLQSGDTIELRWSAGRPDDASAFTPLAIQKMEIYPTVAEPKKIRPGSLIISEILPRHTTENGFVEYAEIYNSTEKPINLKGLILDAGHGEIVIHEDLIAGPYQAVVIANYENIVELEPVVDFKYNGTLFESKSGRIEARFENNEVAKALYDISESGVALQLDHLRNAYDGYSGMRHFVPVRGQWGDQINGNPGVLQPDRKLFSKQIDRKGWHIMSPPGRLSENLNRDIEENLSPLPSNQENEEEAGILPFIYYHDSDEPVLLFSEGVSGAPADRSERPVHFGAAQLRSLEFANYKPFSLNRLISEHDNQAYPALLTWNSKRQSFELVWHRNDQIEPWSALFAPAISSEDYQSRVSDTDEENRSETGLDRMLQLSLIDEDGARQLQDVAVIGFWNAPSEIADDRLDLPKIWNPIEDASDAVRSSVIYLKTPEAKYPANSYLNFDRIPSEVVQVSVGIRVQQSNGRYRIQWGNIESLPDHWDIEFVDAELDEVVDIRRENSYTFFERSSGVTEGMRNPNLNFNQVEQTDYNRFFVRISSTGPLGEFKKDDVITDSIELKQNYPNPFNPSTTVVFYLPDTEQVRVGVYNVVGQQVGVLVDEQLSAGEHTVMWNAMDMPSGVYIVQLEAGNTVKTRKITLIK